MIRPCRSSAGSFVLLVLGAALSAAPADTPPNATVATAESAFLDYLDAVGAVGFIESGGAKSFGGKDLAAWTTRLDAQRKQLDEAMSRIEPGKLDAADRDAVASMRRSVTELAADDTTAGVQVRTLRRCPAPRPRLRLAACSAGQLLRRARQSPAVRRRHDRSRHRAAIAARRRRPRAAQGPLRRLRAALDGAQWPRRSRQPVSAHDRDGRRRRTQEWLGNRRCGPRHRRHDRRTSSIGWCRCSQPGATRTRPIPSSRGTSVTSTARPTASCRHAFPLRRCCR